MSKRQRGELEAFTVYNDEFQFQENTTTLFAISMAWFRQWQLFVRGVISEEPGPINNTGIAKPSDTIPIRSVRPGSDYAQININLWRFFHGIYGGGPEILLRGSVVEEKVPTKVEEEIVENMEISETDYSIKKSESNEVKTKIVKNVSFEDGDLPIESTSQLQEPNLKKAKQNSSISEISMKKEKKYRAMKNSGLFGVEGNFKSYSNIPDETQQQDNSKPKLEKSVVENNKEIVPLLHQAINKNDETNERKSHNGRNANRKKMKNKSGRKQASAAAANSFSHNNESDN